MTQEQEYDFENLGGAGKALETIIAEIEWLRRERGSLLKLVNEVKEEARCWQLRADDAEAEARELREQLKAEKARRRFEYAPVDAELVATCRDLEPRQLKNLFAYALTGLTACTAVEHTQWLMERFRDACLAVSESVEAEDVA